MGKLRNGIARMEEIWNSFSKCISGTNTENKYFQKGHLPLVRNDGKSIFPEVVISKGAAGNYEMLITNAKNRKRIAF